MVGHVLTRESGSRYTLQRVGTLRVDGLWHEATARAGDTSWQFAGSGTRPSERNATATDEAGTLVGQYRGRRHTLHWRGRGLKFRPVSRWSGLGWRALIAPGSRYVLSDGELTLAEVGESMGRVHEPVVIAVHDAAVVEPGLRLFLAFLAGWLHWCADDRANGD
jgi:hypothetical protein